MNITSHQYWQEVSSIAASLVQESASYLDLETAETFDRDAILDHINDSVLHEAIDGHQWVIYYAYNLDVLQHSNNEEYMINNFGCEHAGEVLQEKGLSGLHSALAYWALYADVQDALDNAFDEYEEALESEEEDQ